MGSSRDGASGVGGAIALRGEAMGWQKKIASRSQGKEREGVGERWSISEASVAEPGGGGNVPHAGIGAVQLDGLLFIHLTGVALEEHAAERPHLKGVCVHIGALFYPIKDQLLLVSGKTAVVEKVPHFIDSQIAERR